MYDEQYLHNKFWDWTESYESLWVPPDINVNKNTVHGIIVHKVYSVENISKTFSKK
jgi:hypothetical protein